MTEAKKPWGIKGTKQLDEAICARDWMTARTLLTSLPPLSAVQLTLAAIFSFCATAEDREWEDFLENLCGNYPPKDIPSWCRMPMDEHQIAGGCWGISHGIVATEGRRHCGDCEYHSKPDVPE